MKMEKHPDYLEQLFEGVYVVDQYRTIMYWNKAAEELTGYSAKDVVGKHCYDNILMHVDAQGKNLCQDGCPLQATMEDGQVYDVSVFLRHRKGHRVPVHVRSVPLRDDAGLIHSSMEFFTRESEKSDYEQYKNLARRAFVDALTGLPNKEYIENKVKSMLSSGVPGDVSQWGLLFIAIDNLREISKEHGMAAADAAIRVTASTLRENIQPGELIARWHAGLFLMITTLDKRSLLLNWSSKIKALIGQSKITGYDDAVLEVCVGGVVVNMGADMGMIVPALEKELRAAREASNKISIQE